jgi:release factor glutamine methyltransferase
MNIAEALAYGRSQLHHSPTPELDTRLLLQHILQRSHSFLIAYGEEPLTAVQQTLFTQAIARAQQQEPIPYILGSAPFFDFDLQVSPAVLIPRPETELLVETAVTHARTHPAKHLVDVGTGSGAIAIAAARMLPQTAVSATDISPPALTIAQANADRLAAGRIRFYPGDLLSPIHAAPDSQVDIIIANLPYITDGEWTALDDGVKWYEPVTALRGGPDGLDLVRELLQQAVTYLRPGGAIFLEIGWQQGAAATQAARHTFPQAQVQLLPDYAGHDRIVAVKC